MHRLLLPETTTEVHKIFSPTDLSADEKMRVLALSLMIGDETLLVNIDGSEFEVTSSLKADKITLNLVRREPTDR